MKLMCLLEHTLESPLKASPDLKFPRQVVIFSASRPNLPSVKLKCSFAAVCNKQTKVMWKICILAKVWWGESGAEDDGAHLSDEGLSCSSSITCSFWFVFSYGSKVWPPCEIKMCFASTDSVLMGIPSSINIVPTNNLQSKLTAFIQSTRKSPLDQSYTSITVRLLLLLEYRFCCTVSCIIGEGFNYLYIISDKNDKSIKMNAVFSFNANLNSGVGKLSKRLLVAFI